MSPTLRPLRFLIACLVGAGLQLCCCNTLAVIQAASRVALGVGGDSSEHSGCCGNHSDDSESQSLPGGDCPDQDHGCLCHLLKHASGLTAGGISSAAPVFFGLVIDAPATAALTTRFVEPLSQAPAIRDQSLVRQHCALIL